MFILYSKRSLIGYEPWQLLRVMGSRCLNTVTAH